MKAEEAGMVSGISERIGAGNSGVRWPVWPHLHTAALGSCFQGHEKVSV